jgi:hypothetical protein
MTSIADALGESRNKISMQKSLDLINSKTDIGGSLLLQSKNAQNSGSVKAMREIQTKTSKILDAVISQKNEITDEIDLLAQGTLRDYRHNDRNHCVSRSAY